MSNLSDALVIPNFEPCWAEGWGWLQRLWQLSYKTVSVILFSLVIFNIFIRLLNWTMLTVSSQVSYSPNGTLTMQLQWKESALVGECGENWNTDWWASQKGGRRFNAIFSKPLWFGNLTRNLLGSRLLMRFLELLGPGVGLKSLGNSRPQRSQCLASGSAGKCWAAGKAVRLRGLWRRFQTSTGITIVHLGQEFGSGSYVSSNNLFFYWL